MTTRDNDEDCRLGFLAAIEVPERGYVGGLLVTNRFGRPLEFQCTTPVKPNRTQEILYGPTLVPFVLGELIGRTLLEKVGVKPHLVLTETQDILEVRKHVGVPVACVSDSKSVSKSPSNDPDQTADEKPAADSEEQDRSTSLQSTPSIGRKLRFHSAHQADKAEVESRIAALPREVDLREPFDRVREALEETTRSGSSR